MSRRPRQPEHTKRHVIGASTVRGSRVASRESKRRGPATRDPRRAGLSGRRRDVAEAPATGAHKETRHWRFDRSRVARRKSRVEKGEDPRPATRDPRPAGLSGRRRDIAEAPATGAHKETRHWRFDRSRVASRKSRVEKGEGPRRATRDPRPAGLSGRRQSLRQPACRFRPPVLRGI